MAEEEVVVAPTASDLKRKLNNLDSEFQPSPNSTAPEPDADGDVAEAGESDAKRPRLVEDNEKADGIGNLFFLSCLGF